MQALRNLALKYPGTEEGVACEGTSLEKRTIKAGGKAFLFLGPRDAMLKLRDSLPEATRLASKEPGRYKVGGSGWVTVTLAEPVPLDVLKRWIDESYRLLAPAKLAAKGLTPPRSNRRASRTVPKQGGKNAKRSAAKAAKSGVPPRQ